VQLVAGATPQPDIEDLVEQYAPAAGLDLDTATSTLTLGVNICRIRRDLGLTASQALQAVSTSLDRFEEPGPDGWMAEWRDRAWLFDGLLTVDGPLDVMSKVRELLFDHQCILVGTNVITDVRHIYDNSAGTVLGGLVVHTLGIRFREGEDYREVHVSLSDAALKELSRKLERALVKESTACRSLETLGLRELTPRRVCL
jgi:hypothetical protein